MKLKKILVAGGVTALAAVLALSVSACSNNSGTETTNTLSASSMAQSEVPDTLDGLCRYMEGNGLIGGTPHDMLADLIGAKEGRMYQFSFNDSPVQVELYEFDTENLNKKAQEILQEVRENGKFTMTGIESSNAYLSDSGKYLMVYHDTNTDEEHTNQSIRASRCSRNSAATVLPWILHPAVFLRPLRLLCPRRLRQQRAGPAAKAQGSPLLPLRRRNRAGRRLLPRHRYFAVPKEDWI